MQSATITEIDFSGLRATARTSNGVDVPFGAEAMRPGEFDNLVPGDRVFVESDPHSTTLRVSAGDLERLVSGHGPATESL